MGNLMNSTFNFEILKGLYNLFSRPSVRVKVGKKKLNLPEDMVISNLTVEQTCGFNSNFAAITIRGVVDEEAREFKESLAGIFNIGSRIDIEVGYEDEVTGVFTGFISGITYKLPKQGDGALIVNCMDIKGIMMNNNNYAHQEYKKSSDMVENLLRQSQYSSFYEDLEARATSQEVLFFEVTDESDYEFVVRLAKKINYEFFVSQDTVIFRPARSQNVPMGILAFGAGIEAIEADYNILGQHSSVEVRNTNKGTGELISGTARSTATYSNSSSASKVLKSAKKIVLDTTVYSQEEAQKRAEAQLEDNSWGFGNIKLQCVGLPEIIPGRFIKVKGIYEDLNKKFYVENVRHELVVGKFITHIDARLNSL